jgi:hypothetical protein
MESQGKRTGREEWRKRIERWSDSGRSAEQFAAELGINAGTLKYWKYRLGKESTDSAAAEPNRDAAMHLRSARSSRFMRRQWLRRRRSLRLTIASRLITSF